MLQLEKPTFLSPGACTLCLALALALAHTHTQFQLLVPPGGQDV